MGNKLVEKLKELLKLENEPVAIKWSVKEPKNIEKEGEKSRFCTNLRKYNFRAPKPKVLRA